VTKSASELMKNPQRDTFTYDVKDCVRFSIPVISALHARIGLPSSFPLSTLTRCLTDPTMTTDHALHNEALSEIGAGLLDYYVSEYLCVRWPRLPMKTQLSALWAYTGESTLTRIAREWGIERTTLKHDPKTKTRDKNTREKLGPYLEWEVREQTKQGWSEGATSNHFVHNMDEKEYVDQFFLFAMQRCVQSIIGGVYVHSVLS
jgi:large subunit ribosomal protein L44